MPFVDLYSFCFAEATTLAEPSVWTPRLGVCTGDCNQIRLSKAFFKTNQDVPIYRTCDFLKKNLKKLYAAFTTTCLLYTQTHVSAEKRREAKTGRRWPPRGGSHCSAPSTLPIIHTHGKGRCVRTALRPWGHPHMLSAAWHPEAQPACMFVTTDVCSRAPRPHVCREVVWTPSPRSLFPVLICALSFLCGTSQKSSFWVRFFRKSRSLVLTDTLLNHSAGAGPQPKP